MTGLSRQFTQCHAVCGASKGFNVSPILVSVIESHETLCSRVCQRSKDLRYVKLKTKENKCDYITELYYGHIYIYIHITRLYYGVILRDYITELYY